MLGNLGKTAILQTAIMPGGVSQPQNSELYSPYAHKKAEQISISGGLTKVNNLFLRGPIPGMCTCDRMASHQSPPSAITSILSVCIFNYKEVLCSVCEGMHAHAWVDRGAM